MKYAILGMKVRFQNIRIRTVASLDFGVAFRMNTAETAFFFVQNLRKYGRRVKSGKGAPVNGAIPAHQRAGMTIAYQCIILNTVHIETIL